MCIRLINGLGESRTPTSLRTPAPKTDASAIPPRGPMNLSVVSGQLSVRSAGNYRDLWPATAKGGASCDDVGSLAETWLSGSPGCDWQRSDWARTARSERVGSASARGRGGRRDRRGWARRLCGGAGGAANRPHGRPDRGDRLDRRPAHVAGRAARRTSLDRAIRGVGLISEAAAGDPRLTIGAIIP